MSQFAVFKNENGYGVECDGAIAYEADMPLPIATELAGFCNENPNATFDEFVTHLCEKYAREAIGFKSNLEQKRAELQKILCDEVTA